MAQMFLSHCHRPVVFFNPRPAPFPYLSSSSPPEYEQNQKGSVVVPRGVIRLVRWERPPPGFLKLNTDGSSRGNPGPSSYGGLLRDPNGRWIWGYSGFIGNHTTSLVAEIRGIYEGLRLVQRKGLQKVIVETDSMAALLLITVGDGSENHSEKGLIEYCRLVMKECSCLMIHTPREGNQCADQIAKLGGGGSWTSREENMEMKHPPRCLIPYLLADAKGLGLPLWDDLIDLGSSWNGPWLVGEDFNIVMKAINGEAWGEGVQHAGKAAMEEAVIHVKIMKW